jgi:ATP-dependent DNA helicase RecG
MKYPASESSTIEFKQEIPSNEKIIKTIVGFCNQHGGRLIIGVADDGVVYGIDPHKAEEMMEYLGKMIYETTAPPIIPLVYTRRLIDKTILVIEVSSGMNKPYYIIADGIAKGTYIRLGRSTLKANADMIEELRRESQGKSYETMPVYQVNRKDLNEKSMQAFFASWKRADPIKMITDELLLSYHLITKEHHKVYPTIVGILMFGDDPQRYFSEAMILCSHFAGIEGRHSIASTDCNGNLFEQFNRAYNFVVSHLDYKFEIVKTQRMETLELPEIAIREALLNAIVHRSYSIKAPTKIAIYDNRVEISSPGNFPGSLNTDNLRQGITFLRNPVICKLFREAGYVEKLGTGLIEIFDSYEEYGLAPPSVIEGENYVKYILPRRKYKTTTQLAMTVNANCGGYSVDVDIKRPELSRKLRNIVELFEMAEYISISDVIAHLNISRATAGRYLAELIDRGVLTRQGVGKKITYALSKNADAK